MQTKNPLFEDLAKAMESAVGLAQAAGEEARGVVRAQGDRIATELDLVRRDELEAVKAVLTAEIAGLRAEIAALRVGGANPSEASSTEAARPADDAG
jgi:BMFP domain-containing protein YqiC